MSKNFMDILNEFSSDMGKLIDGQPLNESEENKYALPDEGEGGGGEEEETPPTDTDEPSDEEEGGEEDTGEDTGEEGEGEDVDPDSEDNPVEGDEDDTGEGDVDEEEDEHTFKILELTDTQHRLVTIRLLKNLRSFRTDIDNTVEFLSQYNSREEAFRNIIEQLRDSLLTLRDDTNMFIDHKLSANIPYDECVRDSTLLMIRYKAIVDAFNVSKAEYEKEDDNK